MKKLLKIFTEKGKNSEFARILFDDSFLYATDRHIVVRIHNPYTSPFRDDIIKSKPVPDFLSKKELWTPASNKFIRPVFPPLPRKHEPVLILPGMCTQRKYYKKLICLPCIEICEKATKQQIHFRSKPLNLEGVLMAYCARSYAWDREERNEQ